MTRAEGVRLLGLCAQSEIALVRRDPVAVALLAQAARAAPDGIAADALSRAAAIARETDLSGPSVDANAARKAVQALTRVASQEAQAAALGEGDVPGGARGQGGSA